jgi:hypothetical protein
VEPVEDVHQGRLAGAVLSEQGVDLSTPQLEVDGVVGDERAEPLGDPAQLERERLAGHRRTFLRGYLTSVGMSLILPSMMSCFTLSI